MQGKDNRDPRKHWDNDIKEEITKWKKEYNEILWMGNANGALDGSNLSEVVAMTGLYDVIGAKYGAVTPKAYIQGSRTINYLLGSEDVVESVVKTGMLVFNNGILTDHRGLFCDLLHH